MDPPARVAAGIAPPIGCYTFRATGITAHLAAQESPRTTKL